MGGWLIGLLRVNNMEIRLDGSLKFLYKRTQERVKHFFFIFNNT